MEYTLAGAAQATGKGRTTIFRAIKKGRISARRLEDGSYRIDAAELVRAFPPDPVEQPGPSPWKGKEHKGTLLDEDGTELAVLRGRLETAEARTRGLEDQLAREREVRDQEREEHGETVRDLRKRLDRAEERVLALSAPPPQPTAQPAQEPPTLVEELRQRLAETEALVRNLTVVAPPVLDPAEQQSRQEPASSDPARVVRGFLDRLLGR